MNSKEDLEDFSTKQDILLESKMGKKGIIRIIEAIIAITIVFIAIISFATIRKTNIEGDLSDRITPLLEEIAENNTMREKIITDNADAEEAISTYLSSRIKETNIGYNARVCGATEVCGLSNYPESISGNVYAGSRIISSNLIAGSQAKKISIFLWFKK